MICLLSQQMLCKRGCHAHHFESITSFWPIPSSWPGRAVMDHALQLALVATSETLLPIA